ncbi:MAG: hypothetical protein Q8R82_02730, partial [Hyphomonadaceae bacterium]|nr:hypothetical protein [Hyphomonadaceae bacterium]
SAVKARPAMSRVRIMSISPEIGAFAPVEKEQRSSDVGVQPILSPICKNWIVPVMVRRSFT